MSRKRLEERSKAVYNAAKHASVGIELAVAICIGYFGGRWFEQRFDWAPWGSLLGLLIGIGAGANTLVRVARDVSREADDDG